LVGCEGGARNPTPTMAADPGQAQDPNLDRVYGMLWYPLHGVGVVPNFYHHLWRGATGFAAFPIPDTVLFRGNRPSVFFFTARGGDAGGSGGGGGDDGAGGYVHLGAAGRQGAESPCGRGPGVSRKHARNVTSANVFSAMCKPHFGRGGVALSRRLMGSPSAHPPSGSSPVCAVLMYESPPASAGAVGVASVPASKPGSGTSTPAPASVILEGGGSRSVDSAMGRAAGGMQRCPGPVFYGRACVGGTDNACHVLAAKEQGRGWQWTVA
jgi:hypothetical protein